MYYTRDRYSALEMVTIPGCFRRPNASASLKPTSRVLSRKARSGQRITKPHLFRPRPIGKHTVFADSFRQGGSNNCLFIGKEIDGHYPWSRIRKT